MATLGLVLFHLNLYQCLPDKFNLTSFANDDETLLSNFSSSFLVKHEKLSVYLDGEFSGLWQSNLIKEIDLQFSRKTSVVDSTGDVFEFDRRSSVIFIGGVERSGLNLLRDIIQAHPVTSSPGSSFLMLSTF